MFNLNETITKYNQINVKKVKANKTWGLVYLGPKRLIFLNKCFQLIEKSVYYEPPFIADLNTSSNAFSREKPSLSEALPTLQTITQKLKTDPSSLQRRNWEENLSERLNSNNLWEECFNQVDTHPRIQSYLMQLQRQWKTHQPFQYHSSKGLLFLLDVVIEYKYHFTQAHKELNKKQATLLAFFRLPNAIAKEYRLFLTERLNYLKNLHDQILEGLLLRLKLAEQKNQVTCEDVSYFVAQEVKRLGLPSLPALPKCQMVLEASAFNNVHRAIEKHGNINQKKRLYQLAWYEYAAFNSEDISVINMSQQRLLLPKVLLKFWPKKYRKCLFTEKSKQLEFLKTQQALLAQLTLSSNFSMLPLEFVSITHPTLRSLTTRYQLIQQSLQSVDQSVIRWWQWYEKRWKKAWQSWLVEQLDKNQATLTDCLTEFYQQVQSREDLLSQATYREKVKHIIQAIQSFIYNNPFAHRYIFLTIILEQLFRMI